jgi:hypothetical protein
LRSRSRSPIAIAGVVQKRVKPSAVKSTERARTLTDESDGEPALTYEGRLSSPEPAPSSDGEVDLDQLDDEEELALSLVLPFPETSLDPGSSVFCEPDLGHVDEEGESAAALTLGSSTSQVEPELDPILSDTAGGLDDLLEENEHAQGSRALAESQAKAELQDLATAAALSKASLEEGTHSKLGEPSSTTARRQLVKPSATADDISRIVPDTRNWTDKQWNQLLRSGNLVRSDFPVHLERYTRGAKEIDPVAEFEWRTSGWRLRCSQCGGWFAGGAPWRLSVFRTHRRACMSAAEAASVPLRDESQEKKTALRPRTLDSWGWKKSTTSSQSATRARTSSTPSEANGEPDVRETGHSESIIPAASIPTTSSTVKEKLKPSTKGKRPAVVVEPDQGGGGSIATTRGSSSTSSSTPASSRVLVTRPCNGITEAFEPRISNYMRRAGPLLAGAASETVLAKLHHDLAYKDLSDAQQNEIDLLRQHGTRWRKEYNHPGAPGGAVFATACLKTVQEHPDLAAERVVCEQCRAVCRDGNFQTILRKPVPKADNFRFANRAYVPDQLFSIYARCEAIHDLLENKVRALLAILIRFADLMVQDFRHSPAFRYAELIAQGKLQDQPVFNDLMAAIVHKQQRLEDNRGIQNFPYGAALDNFAQVSCILSKTQYNVMREVFPMRTAKSHRCAIVVLLI